VLADKTGSFIGTFYGRGRSNPICFVFLPASTRDAELGNIREKERKFKREICFLIFVDGKK